MTTTGKRPAPGEEAEERACELLRAEGYEIVARNWHCRHGEIDIVARDGGVLVFVEVKSRAGAGFGGPEGAVDWRKQQRLTATVRAFLAMAPTDLPMRFDVVAFTGGHVRLLRDAFRAEDACSPD